ncbi:MAG: hypothetical protein M0P09_06760 [Acholeplasmataceae bacterium]|nr:hypothetical protein [Acholeplasmataceae bacterium]
MNLDCQPKAEPFVRAIQACEDTVHLALTPAGRLTVKSGKFRVHVECSPEEFPDAVPTGVRNDADLTGLIAALKALEPLIAEDASRPWARSILIQDGCLYATNNIILVQYWIGIQTPGRICISHAAVNELIRIGLDPIAIQTDTDNSITFHYGEDRWLKTHVVTQEWPDLNRVLNRESTQEPFPEQLFQSLDLIAPFADKTRDVWFAKGGVTTSLVDQEGATQEVEELYPQGWYDIDQLRSLNGLIDTADFSMYPAPVLFFGMEGALRGAIVGRKDGTYPPASE